MWNRISPRPQSPDAESLVAHLSDDELDSLLASSSVPVVVDFWAPWCAPCNMLAPTIERLAREYDGRVRFVKLNVDDHQRWASTLGVRGIPTVAIFSGGKVVQQMVGVRPEADFRSAIDALLRSASP